MEFPLGGLTAALAEQAFPNLPSFHSSLTKGKTATGANCLETEPLTLSLKIYHTV